MRSHDEVMVKFIEVRNTKLKEMKHSYLSKIPINCVYNNRLRVKGRGQVGFCSDNGVCAKSKNGLFVCNDEETSRHCISFCCKHTEQSVERDFMDILKSPARCGEEYPKLAMLIWFLQDVDKSEKGGNNLFDFVIRKIGVVCQRFRWW